MPPQDYRDNFISKLEEARVGATQAFQRLDAEKAKIAWQAIHDMVDDFMDRLTDILKLVSPIMDKSKSIGGPLLLREIGSCTDIFVPLANSQHEIVQDYTKCKIHLNGGKYQEGYDGVLEVIGKLKESHPRLMEAEKKARELYRAVPLEWKQQDPRLQGLSWRVVGWE